MAVPQVSMMEVRHTDSHFYPQIPDSVWEDAPRVHWETFSEDVEDLMKNHYPYATPATACLAAST